MERTEILALVDEAIEHHIKVKHMPYQHKVSTFCDSCRTGHLYILGTHPHNNAKVYFICQKCEEITLVDFSDKTKFGKPLEVEGEDAHE